MSRNQQRKRAKPKQRQTAPRRPKQAADNGSIDDMMAAAIGHHQAGQLQQAEVLYRQALAVQPKNPDALHLLGVIAYQAGRHDAAVDLIRQAISENERNPDYHQNLGNALQTLGRNDEAVTAYQRALAIDPDNAQVLSNLGGALASLGQYEESLNACRRALGLTPDFAEAHNNLGNALRALATPDVAMAAFRQAIEIKPDFAEAHNNLGNALKALCKFDDSLASFHRALAIRPDYAAAHNNLGTALKEMGRQDEAAAAYRRALEIEPTYADALYNLGNTFLVLDAPDEAAATFRRTVALKPEFADAHNNLGTALQAQGRIEEAVAAFRAARDIDPDYGDAHQNLGMALLLSGDLRNGWDEYEWRWKASDFSSPAHGFPQPLWDGSDLAGKTILLHAEQGLGDTIQFVRYARLVAACGGHVVLECPGALAKLMAGAAGVEEVVVSGAPLPAFDTHCPLIGLPRIFDTSLATIPGSVPYLNVDGGTAAAWRDRLGSAPGLKVGLVWAGNPSHKNDRNRSIAVHYFKSLLRTPGVSFFGFQVGDRSADLAMLDCDRVEDLSPLLTDFAETAAAMQCLDLLISVDTATAHLAGALGTPTWLLLPFIPDWRWMLERDDSPWYPTMRLFRQTEAGDWDAVIERLEHTFRAFTTGECALTAFESAQRRAGPDIAAADPPSVAVGER